MRIQIDNIVRDMTPEDEKQIFVYSNENEKKTNGVTVTCPKCGYKFEKEE